MRSTLNSFILDFGHDQPTNYGRMASVSLITGIHLTDLENALVVASDIGSADVQGGDVNHLVERVCRSAQGIRFKVFNRYETTDKATDTPILT
jgi:hypothetical protein